MRLIVILSPTNKWGTKTEYTNLRKFLIKDGYLRIAQTHRKTIRQHHHDNRRTRLSGTNRWYKLPYYEKIIS